MINRLLQSAKQYTGPYYRNLRGWRTGRKIIVFESDDWGNIRMPSKAVYEESLRAGYRVDKNPYERYDGLASEDDLELLYELLTSVRDTAGRHPVLTANCLSANPDFDKIRESGFREYHYELITDTFRQYPKHARCFDLWKEGLEQGIFFPQCHGREHLNVSKYMSDLQSGCDDQHFGFSLKKPGMIPKSVANGKNEYQEAANYNSSEDKTEKLAIFLESLELFERLFGYRSRSFIPPTYKWSPDFDKDFSDSGVRYYQGRAKMIEPGVDGVNRVHKYCLGQKNRYGQVYLIRNSSFEPTTDGVGGEDIVNRCLHDISAAFRLNKPAIIATHRINFVGFIDESNRDKNLRSFQHLLHQIIKQWPGVEFMNSAELGNLISGAND